MDKRKRVSYIVMREYYIPMADQPGFERFTPTMSPDRMTEGSVSKERQPMPHNIVILANQQIDPKTAGGLVNAMDAYSRTNEHANITSIGWDRRITPPEELRESLKKRRSKLQVTEMEALQEVSGLLKQNGPISTFPIQFTKEEHHAHYEDISNNWYWPIFHGQPQNIDGDFSYDNYVLHDHVVDKFADAHMDYTEHHPASQREVWINDYHLMLLAPKLKERGVKDPIGFFLHIPFPTPEMFEYIPEVIEKEGYPTRYPRKEILEGLLANDLVGFQTMFDARRFLQCLDAEYVFTDDQVQQTDNGYLLRWGDRTIKIGAYPIGVDAVAIKEKLETPDVIKAKAKFEEEYGNKTLIVDASRLDPSKGIIPEIDAFEALLDKFETKDPDLLDKLLLVRIVAPSREAVPAYARLKKDIFDRVNRINEKYAHRGAGNKIDLIYDNVPNHIVLALLDSPLTRVALVSTEADGMNLVAKEAGATNNKNLRIIVGAGAGVSKEISGMALTPRIRSNDPKSTRNLAANLYVALKMSDEVAHKRKQALEEHVETHGVGEWGAKFMTDLQSRKAVA